MSYSDFDQNSEFNNTPVKVSYNFTFSKH
uniref:Uncharacterized protein n=1 Tax=Rhizophora mucronata TaxID=61149 RepID=A0A2P2KD97_RHIMU